MSLTHSAVRLVQSMKTRGVAGTLGRMLRQPFINWEDRSYDRVHRVDTRGMIQLSQLTIASANVQHGIMYHPTKPYNFREVLQHAPAELSEYTFIDFGSGKGRTVLLAAEYAFRRIIGIEFSPELVGEARRNLGNYRGGSHRCPSVELLCLDAVEFEFPHEHSFLYFYYPFTLEVLEPVLSNLARSLAAAPRSVYVAYYTNEPWDRAIESAGLFEPIWRGARCALVRVRERPGERRDEIGVRGDHSRLI
jgi:SAM-dependent methyltransferase